MTGLTVFRRAFPVTLEQTGPRELAGRCVPFGVVADVVDELPDGTLDIYQEGFRPGAFMPQATTPERGVLQRIGVVHSHDGGLGYLGPCVALREEADGLWFGAAVLRSKASDVEDLLAAGVNEISIEFRQPRHNSTEIDADGVRWRTKAHLDQIALEPRGAYTGARVAAFRAELDELAREETERKQAEAQAAADAQAEREAAEARARQAAELDEWLAAEQARQDELRARYLSA